MPGIMGPGAATPEQIAKIIKNAGKPTFQPIPTPQGATKPLAYMTLREKQEFLKGLGYAIDVDGKWGPQTEGAWKNWVAAGKTNKGARYWSKNSRLSNAFKEAVKTVAASSPPTVADIVPAAATTKGGATPTVKGTSVGSVKVAPLNLAAQLKALQANVVNPKQYLDMLTQAQNPALDMLRQEITRRETRGPSGVDENLRKWYEQMMGQANAGAAATSAASERILGGHDAATAGLVNVLGGSASPAASSAAAFGNIARGELAAGAQAQNQFEGAQAQNLALEGLEARLNARQEDQSALDELRLKLIELQGGQGQDRAAAWLDALKLRDSQIQGIADIKGIMSMANADAIKTGQGLTAGALANKRSALDYDIDSLKLAMGLKNMAQGPITPWDQLDPSKLQGLRKELLGGAVNDQNQLLYDPMTTMNAMGAALRGLSGGQWNPFNNAKIDRWRDDLLKSLIPGWNKAHPKKKWAFNKKGKLVRI